MNIQDHVIATTGAAALEVFRYALIVPADKVDWKPLDNGRSVIDIARELAKTPDWAGETIAGEGSPEWTEEAFAAQKAEMATWTTVEQCQAECLARLEKFYEVVRSLGDEDLAKTKWLPYDGGRDFTFAEMLDYPRWNFNYHLGQIAYIQTLYGDRDMH